MKKLFSFIGRVLSISILLGLLLSGCYSFQSATPTPIGAYPINPKLADFYKEAGGEERLGPAISLAGQMGDRFCQYTLNALLCLEPNQDPEQGRMLYPVGQKIAPQDEPLPDGFGSKVRIQDGYILFEEFTPLFDKLGGSSYTGKARSHLRINYRQQRLEQFFESVGFYRRLQDSPGQVHLLAYGAAHCGNLCEYPVTLENAVDLEIDAAQQPFALAVYRWNSLRSFGQPLTQPYLTEDGSLEQIYENVVIFSPPDAPQDARLRMLNSSENQPVEANPDKRMVFIKTDGEMGFNVPKIFEQRILENGGWELAGKPVSEVLETTIPGLYRQCFQAYCLEYQAKGAEASEIHFSPQGYDYLEQANLDANLILPKAQTDSQIDIKIVLAKPAISSRDDQQITIDVTNQQDHLPMIGAEGVVVISMPDGSLQSYPFEPTGADGRAVVKIPAMRSITNGSLIRYDVCVHLNDTEPVCSADTYLIWNNP